MKEKTLYVSDLDGTLLNKKKEITGYTAEVLNRCIEKGMRFAVATARMPYGCDYRLENIHMNIPGILTNGVFLYDFQKGKIISAEEMTEEGAVQVTEAFHRHGLSCFVYTYDETGISIYYEKQKMEEQTQYYSRQALVRCAEIRRVKEIKEILPEKRTAYIAYSGEKEKLELLCRELDKIEGIRYSFYLNIYNGRYCLEIFSHKASKKNALEKLKEMTNSQELVVFGDNLNDLSMMEIADRSYAPKNALKEIKERANQVIGGCDEDGVAAFLEKEWG